MSIGTAKPTIEEMQGIKHYMIDFVSPDERYSVADYKNDAKKVGDKVKVSFNKTDNSKFVTLSSYEIMNWAVDWKINFSI